MLAYSSIAHAGYMTMALLSQQGQSGGSLLFYTAAYSVSSLAAFAILYLVHLEARRLRLAGMPPEEIPSLAKVLKSSWHLFIPLVVMVTLLSSPASDRASHTRSTFTSPCGPRCSFKKPGRRSAAAPS